MSRIWLVTGSGHGLGRDIVEAALAAGDKVVATAREPALLDDLVEKYGGSIRTASLDVTDEAQCRAAIHVALDAFDRIDIVVNNAGYGDSRPFEEFPPDDFKRLVDTVFTGTVHMTRAAVRIMRAQQSGLIMQVSSVGGRAAWPGQAAYHAAKWAVGGFTDAVRAETAGFGVRLLTLEPGAIRTGWGKRAYKDRWPMGEDYLPTVGETNKMLESFWGNEPIDPKRFAALIVRLSRMDELPARLLVGGQGADLIKQLEAERAKVAERWRQFSDCVEYDSTIAVEDAVLL